MKKYTYLVCLLLSAITYSQVGVNTEIPAATLDVVGNPTDPLELDGIIAPRLSGDELSLKNYTSAQTGALVYATAAAGSLTGQVINVSAAGYYYFDGAVWQTFNGDCKHTDYELTSQETGKLWVDDSPVYEVVGDITLATNTNVIDLSALDFPNNAWAISVRFINKVTNSVSTNIISFDPFSKEMILGTAGSITTLHPAGDYYIIIEYVNVAIP